MIPLILVFSLHAFQLGKSSRIKEIYTFPLGEQTKEAIGGTYESTHYWAELPKGCSHLPCWVPLFFKWWKEQVFMWSGAWHSWFLVKLCPSSSSHPAVKSERDCLLLMQSEYYSIDRFPDYLFPCLSKAVIFLKSGYLFFKGNLTQKHSQNR